MKILLTVVLYLAFVSAWSQPMPAQSSYPPEEKVAAEFKKLLQRPLVKPRPAFESFVSDTLVIEKGFIYSEEAEKVPVLIYKPVLPGKSTFPVVICLHGTGGSKEDESMQLLLRRFVKIGIMGVAIDARYHGERVPGGAHKSAEYLEAVTKAWQNKDSSSLQHPFYYDTVYDLWRLTDYLVTRADVQPARIGMMGISMGGIETWMAAAVDKRIKVAVPVIAAQSFKWSLENDRWQGRAATIWTAHQQAARDIGDTAVNQKSVEMLWSKLVPGITDAFDCPSMLRLIAPRPLLLLSNEKDQNCPLPGAQVAFAAATQAYRAKKAADKMKIHVTPNEPHRFLPEHGELAIAWFKKWL